VFLAADYPFLDVLWTMLVFFLWIAWIFLLFRIVADVFRRHDIRGGKKAVWLLFILLVPFVGVLTYLIVNNDSMMQRDVQQAQASQEQFNDYVRSVSGSGAAAEIDKAKQLLDNGTITQAEFDAIKSKALASA
jgi:predicted PurR-regulated permease PerM